MNSFTNYLMGTNYSPVDTTINNVITINNPVFWGQGEPLRMNTPTAPYVSHTSQFNDSQDRNFTCSKLGTYEITTNVVFRNTSNSRQNPCIGIAVNNDTTDGTGPNDGPQWDLVPYYQTSFATAYARLEQGKVCSLTAKRIHHFTNMTDNVSIRTYIQTTAGDNFQDSSFEYFILSATIQFKYIGNFNSIA